MFSVVIPLYNKEALIEQTVERVLLQTYQDFEVIVVDDGSTDKGVEVVKEFDDKRIRIIQQENQGVSAARNKGIEESQGEYIAFLDADDKWETDYLETQHCLIKKYPKCSVYATNYKFINEFGENKSSIIRRLPFSESDGELTNYFEVACHSNPPLWTSAVVVKKEAILAIGGFPTNITSGEDLLTWAKLATYYKIAYTMKTVATYFTPTTGPTGKTPSDLSTTKDAVGFELISLYKSNPNNGLRNYIAFWYKMRARINLDFRNSLGVWRCATKSLHYNPFQIKPIAFIFLSLLR